MPPSVAVCHNDMLTFMMSESLLTLQTSYPEYLSSFSKDHLQKLMKHNLLFIGMNHKNGSCTNEHYSNLVKQGGKYAE